MPCIAWEAHKNELAKPKGLWQHVHDCDCIEPAVSAAVITHSYADVLLPSLFCACRPLYVAARLGHTAVVMALADAGAGLSKSDGAANDFGITVAKNPWLEQRRHTHPLDPTPSHVFAGESPCSNRAACYCITFSLAPARAQPLMVAASQGHADVVRELLSHGADHREKNNHGCTPLWLACAYGRLGAVDELLKARAQVEAADNHECTPLVAASQRGEYAVMKKLIAKGARQHVPATPRPFAELPRRIPPPALPRPSSAYRF